LQVEFDSILGRSEQTCEKTANASSSVCKEQWEERYVKENSYILWAVHLVVAGNGVQR
jgi:hypothetical protein